MIGYRKVKVRQHFGLDFVRLTQIPGYLICFAVGLAMLGVVVGLIFAILIFFYCVYCLIITSILTLGSTSAAIRDKRMNVRTAFFLSFLNYIFCVDVINAVILYIVLARAKYREKQRVKKALQCLH